MSISYLLYLVVGKILLFFGKRFAEDNNWRGFVGKLLTCNLCGGLWIYSFMSWVLGEVLFREYFYVPILSEVVTGGFSAILVHLFTLGWQAQFEVIEI
jgi:hypothetical protein